MDRLALLTAPRPVHIGLADHLRACLADFAALAREAEFNVSPARRGELAALDHALWTEMVAGLALIRPFNPLAVALDAAAALIRKCGWSVDQLAREMERADALDVLAAGPDLTRNEAAWVGVIVSEAQGWHDAASWRDAMIEVLVWAFRAWAIRRPAPIPPAGATLPAGAVLLERLTAWTNPDMPLALRRAFAA